ncbi:hypothetical protein ZONE111905_15145 [Zobellia nedashkovskayae]
MNIDAFFTSAHYLLSEYCENDKNALIIVYEHFNILVLPLN